MSKQMYLLRFRRASQVETLEKMYEHMKGHVSNDEIEYFMGAYDHRKAELAVGKNFDKIPASVWQYVQ
jgi:hemolysin expression modulating protein